MKHIAALLSLLLLFGCNAVGPDFVSPPVDTQCAWTEEGHHAIHADGIPIGRWWHLYQDPILDELVDLALQDNYDLQAAVHRIQAARANLGFAIGQYFPQTQQAEGSLIRNHVSSNAPNTLNADRDFIDGILGFRMAWELDFWGRFSRGVQVAYGEYVATENDYLDVRRILVSDLVTASVLQKTFQKRIATLESNIKIQYRSVEIAKVRWEKGYESELDYAQAVTLWKETEAQKIALEVELKRATTSIAILVGMTPEAFLCHFPLNIYPLHAPQEADIWWPAEVLCQRPDLQRSLDQLYAQSARIGVAVSDLYPRISFTGFLGLEAAGDTHSAANQKGKHFFSRNSLTFFYGPEFSWPILNYCRLENKVWEQEAFLREGIVLYREQVLVAYKEVEDALTFFTKSIEQTEALSESYKYAKRSVDISTLQYQEGLADYTRVLNSLQLQVAAEDSLAQAEGNISLAYALIYKSLGAF